MMIQVDWTPRKTATNPEIGEEEWNNDSDFQGDAKKTRWPINEVVAEERGIKESDVNLTTQGILNLRSSTLQHTDSNRYNKITEKRVEATPPGWVSFGT
jgi:hypothetical protein